MRSVFGWDLPPGCTQRHIDEAAGGDSAAEAFFDAMLEANPPLMDMDEDKSNAIIDWAWSQVEKAYGDGYKQGQADTQLAMQESQEDQ